MKKLLVLPLALLSTAAFAHSLPNFLHVKGAVTHGANIRVAVDFSKCTADPKNGSPSFVQIGVYSPNEIILTNDGNIATSMLHFSRKDPRFSDQATYLNVRYTFKPNEDVLVSGVVMDARDFTPLTAERSYICKMDDGVKVYV